MTPVLRKSKSVEWLKLAVAKGYRVDPDGSLHGPEGPLNGSVHHKNTPKKNRGSYWTVTVKVSPHKCVRVYAHQLQGYQKYGDASLAVGAVVRHLNGDSLDNRVENIGIGTMRDNQLDRGSEALKAHAQLAANAKKHWSDDDVRRLRALWQSGTVKLLHLALEEGVSQSTLSMMLNGVTYKSVVMP